MVNDNLNNSVNGNGIGQRTNIQQQKLQQQLGSDHQQFHQLQSQQLHEQPENQVPQDMDTFQRECEPDMQQGNQQIQNYISALLEEAENSKKVNAELRTSLTNAIEQMNILQKDLTRCLAENNELKNLLQKSNTKNPTRKIAKKKKIIGSVNDIISDTESQPDNSHQLTNSPGLSGNSVQISSSLLNVMPATQNLNINKPDPVNIAGASNVSSANVKKKIIQVVDADLQSLNRKLKAANCNNYVLRQGSINSPIRVTVTNPDEVSEIRNTLANNKISFHEFKASSEKDKCFLIKGLSGASADDVPFIKQELIDAGLPENITLLMFSTGYMRANTKLKHNSFFKLIVPHNFDTNILSNIKYLDHMAISFEAFKSKSIIQCKNCQRFGHSTGGCHHPHRCVKCGLNHLRDKCERTVNKAIKLICCNCGGEHSANNLSVCKYFLNNYSSPVKNSITNPVPNRLSLANLRFPATQSTANADHINKKAVPTKGELSYAQILKNGNQTSDSNVAIRDLSKKIDMILQLVQNHDNAINKIING